MKTTEELQAELEAVKTAMVEWQRLAVYGKTKEREGAKRELERCRLNAIRLDSIIEYRLGKEKRWPGILGGE